MSPRAPRRVRRWVRDAERPWVLGHRGARRRAPENTLAAFELALEEGADGVELDVRLDLDGDVVVIHDPDLARVTSGKDSRCIAELTRAELAGVDLGNKERVPRLEEVLRWARQRDARVNVELKSDVPRRSLLAWRVARLIAGEPHAAERLILSSFDPLLVAAAARLLPWMPVGWLVEARHPMPSRSFLHRLVGATALHPQTTMVTASSVAAWQRAGLPVNVWTVNDPADARRLNELRVDTLISDEPRAILRALG